ncbi:MAG: DUF6577 family protein [Sedimentibacter sp.]|uniref:DUF6577 family protein n=1 Tax=Sedimentibacter sp. TaxID=1960295 RepID=UPI0029817FDE|nr:DUF6577 family protein [Sedimentibacter sp.]MDW5300644.1 DUF6577 family protein [Sedimentibacter sp.]
MRKQKSSLEVKYQLIKENLRTQLNIYFNDIQAIFPDSPKSSLYWMLSKMVDEGYLKRVRNGVYSFNEMKGKSAVYLSNMARQIKEILDEEGFEYYISGMDVLSKFMQHVPENYPIIVFVEKTAYQEILWILREKNIMATEPTLFKETFYNYMYTSEKSIVILYKTDNFNYEENNIATTEKAFIDLFYAITRNKYPLAIQELARAYNNMVRLGAIDQRKLVKTSYIRNLQYDIRYIVESKYITEDALEFVNNIRREY